MTFDPENPNNEIGAYESALLAQRNALIMSMVEALQNGVSFARCLEVLGVEGKAQTMLRAMLSRFSDDQLAEMLGSMATANPSNEGLAVEAP